MVNDSISISAGSTAKSSPRRKVNNPIQPSFRQEPDWLIIFAGSLFLLSLAIAWLVIVLD